MTEPTGKTAPPKRPGKANNGISAEPHRNPVYTVWVIGFVVLLLLIWVTGQLSVDTVNDISNQAGERSNDYNRRLTLALNIRYAAANAIVEARLVRGCDSRVPIPPFRRKLNEAKRILDKRISEGRAIWEGADANSAISAGEAAAWKQVADAAGKFADTISAAEKAGRPGDSPTPTAPANVSAETSKERLAVDLNSVQVPSPSVVQPELQPVPMTPETDEFLGTRNQLEEAADNLARAVMSVRDNMLITQYTSQQTQVATRVRHTTGMALAVGILIATITFILAQRQINQTRRAMQEEQDAKDFARSVFDSQLNYIVVVGRHGELLSVNQAFLNSLRLPPSALALQDYQAAFAHMPDIAAYVKKMLDDPGEMAVHRERIEVKPKDDRATAPPNTPAPDMRVYDVSLYPLLIGGRPKGRVIVLADVTTVEKQREELRKSRTLTTLGQVTAQVAHELYNPIGAVKLNIELLEMQLGGNDDVKHTLARLKRGAEHLSTIAQDLRYLTKPRDPERKPTDLNRLLDEVVELASDRLERTRIRVVRSYADDLPSGEYDPQQLRKVFLNLLINAVEASPQSGEVELRTDVILNGRSISTAGLNRSRGILSISVIDHGIGMSPETKRRLFEAFYTTKRNGTGLGMMITQEVIKKHGGKIEVESEEGRGTTVNVYLPV